MAVHILEEAQRCLNCKVPQCQKGCPIHTPIPKAIRLMLDGKLDEAGWMLFENNPLTTVCSLVCNHENQCEGHCVLGRKGAPVHFSSIESYISTTYSNKMVKGPAPVQRHPRGDYRLRTCGSDDCRCACAQGLSGDHFREQG